MVNSWYLVKQHYNYFSLFVIKKGSCSSGKELCLIHLYPQGLEHRKCSINVGYINYNFIHIDQNNEPLNPPESKETEDSKSKQSKD